MQMNIKLPSIPSELIKLALVNMRECESSPHYVINFAAHHSGIINASPCKVSSTGAVMAQTLKADPFLYLRPDSFDKDISTTLWALYDIQRGRVERGIERLGLDQEFKHRNKRIDTLWSTGGPKYLFNIPFDRDRDGEYFHGDSGTPFNEKFYNDMELLILEFKKINL